MAVRGLGCPVRFTLTAGQKGDAPQASALIEGLPAEVVIADTAYDADHLRKDIAAKKALAVIPNNPSRALKHPLDKHLYASAISWNAASQNSSSSVASLPASKRPPEITEPSSLSPPSSYGCDKCPHCLEVPRPCVVPRRPSLTASLITHVRTPVRLDRAPPEFRYVYFWYRMDRKGHAYAVLARGTMNSCLVVRFVITSRNKHTSMRGAQRTRPHNSRDHNRGGSHSCNTLGRTRHSSRN